MLRKLPDPSEFRQHHRLAGVFAPGAALTNAVVVSLLIPLAGARAWRVHWKSSAPGSLTAPFVNPIDDTPYTAGNPAAVPVLADTEVVLDVAAHLGEAMALLTFTPTGNGVVTYADLSQVRGG